MSRYCNGVNVNAVPPIVKVTLGNDERGRVKQLTVY